MYTFQNDQLHPHTDSNNIQELGTILSSTKPSQIQLSNTASSVTSQLIKQPQLSNTTTSIIAQPIKPPQL